MVRSFKKQHHYIIGYVPKAFGMPSHVHAIIAFSNTGKNINTIVSNGKHFIAYDLISRLQQQNSTLILSELSSSLNNKERKEGRLHSAFETSFDWKPGGRQEMQNRKIHSAKIRLFIFQSCKETS